jgi:hypothetical protein
VAFNFAEGRLTVELPYLTTLLACGCLAMLSHWRPGQIAGTYCGCVANFRSGRGWQSFGHNYAANAANC